MNIENITDKIVTNFIERAKINFENKIFSLFKKCDSPIEKVFLAFLIDKVANEIEFISNDITFLQDNIFAEDNFYECFGIKFTSKSSVNANIDLTGVFTDGKKCPGYREIIIIPQYKLEINKTQSHKLIDIAIFSQRNYEDSKEIIIDKKIAIECDGHEFPTTREQIYKDNRLITSNGFTVLRYLESEIYEECKSNMENVFEELINILEIEELPDVFKTNSLKGLI